MTTATVYHINYDPSLRTVVTAWKGYATSTQFRAGTLAMLDALVANGMQKMLVDAKEMVLIGRDDQDWMDRSFLPKAIGEGLRAVALVQPDSYFNQVAVESIIYKVDQEQLKVSYFKTIEEAKEWLQNFPF